MKNKLNEKLITHEFGHASADVCGEVRSMLSDYPITIMTSNLIAAKKEVRILYEDSYSLEEIRERPNDLFGTNWLDN